ncbi:hypothetical protein CMV00_11805 [Elizabethkingia anophelis]|nr:hypothetical protein [Elizabethkingia anophelis]
MFLVDQRLPNCQGLYGIPKLLNLKIQKMKNLKKISRENLKELTGGQMPVTTGGYACCIGNQCSSIVNVEFYDDLYCERGDLIQFY